MQCQRGSDVLEGGISVSSVAGRRTTLGISSTAKKTPSQTPRRIMQKTIRAPAANSSPVFRPTPEKSCPAGDADAFRPVEAAPLLRAQTIHSCSSSGIREFLRLPQRRLLHLADLSALPFRRWHFAALHDTSG